MHYVTPECCWKILLEIPFFVFALQCVPRYDGHLGPGRISKDPPRGPPGP